jgi:hypothetical protein
MTWSPPYSVRRHIEPMTSRSARALRAASRSTGRTRVVLAARTAVISSPNLGVFAVTAAGPGLRRGHVICSGVIAVAAVAAAGVSCLVQSACWTGGRGARRDLAGSQFPSALGRDRQGPAPVELGAAASQGDGRGCGRPDPRRDRALRRPGGAVAAAAAAAGTARHRSAWPACRYRPRRDHAPATGNRVEAGSSARSALQRAHHAQDPPAGPR